MVLRPRGNGLESHVGTRERTKSSFVGEDFPRKSMAVEKSREAFSTGPSCQPGTSSLDEQRTTKGQDGWSRQGESRKGGTFSCNHFKWATGESKGCLEESDLVR